MLVVTTVAALLRRKRFVWCCLFRI